MNFKKLITFYILWFSSNLLLYNCYKSFKNEFIREKSPFIKSFFYYLSKRYPIYYKTN